MEAWRVETWLAGHPGVARALAGALLFGEQVDTAEELTFARGMECTKEAVRARLAKGGALDQLADTLVDAFSKLQAADTASAAELHDKFVLDGSAFTLQLGGLDKFYSGLDGIVGSASPNVHDAMRRDHCQMNDSAVAFDMPNRRAKTTSTIEWRFVVSPKEGSDGNGAPFAPYPKETNSRRPQSFEEFGPELRQRNAALAAISQPSVGREEFYGARLYTGPMYLKYNAVLRGRQFESARANFEELCGGNTYATTLHCINSSIIKLSKLTKAAKVYRGVSGGVLPDSCRVSNDFDVRGGVEGGFMSTTTDHKTALFYAQGGADAAKRGGSAILFESQMGMVDRGADVGWLSEFPHEAEILFAPLTGMEVRGSRVEGSVQIYEVALTVNMASLTIEQVVVRPVVLGLLLWSPQ